MHASCLCKAGRMRTATVNNKRGQTCQSSPTSLNPVHVVQVGQRVTARHPVTRQLHDGDILTTGGAYYRHVVLAAPWR